MAKISTLKFFYRSLIAIFLVSYSHAEEISTVKLPISTMVAPAPETYTYFDNKTKGIHLATVYVFNHLHLYLKQCLFVDCGLTNKERDVLEAEVKLMSKANNGVFPYFAYSSEELFSSIPENEYVFFTKVGITPGKDLFDLPQYKTHRFVITGNQPGPIIFNQNFLMDPDLAPSLYDIYGFYVHELGHQLGLGYEDEAFLDRLALKVSQAARKRGGEVTYPGNKDLRIWVFNFATTDEYIQMYKDKIAPKNSNLGHALVYGNQSYIPLTEGFIASTITAGIFDSVPGYIWMGAPNITDTIPTEEFENVLVVNGRYTYILDDLKDDSVIRSDSKYQVLIPLTDANGKKDYLGENIYISSYNLFNPHSQNEVAIKDKYQVLDLKVLEPAYEGVEARIKCPTEPYEVSISIKNPNQKLYKIIDFNFPYGLTGKLVSRNNNVCSYKFSTGVQGSGAYIDSLTIFEDKLTYAIVAPPKKIEIPWLFLEPPPDKIEVKLFAPELKWVDYRNPEKAMQVATSDLFAEQLMNDDRYGLSFEIQIGVQDYRLMCSASLVVSGESKVYPNYAKKMYLNSGVPGPGETELEKANLFESIDYELYSSQHYKFKGFLNKKWIRSHLKNARLDHLKIQSCYHGPIYYEF